MTSTPILDRLTPLPASQGITPPPPKKTRRRDMAIVVAVTVGTALWIIFMIASPYAFQVGQVLGGLFDRLLPVTSANVPSMLTVLWYLGVTPLLAFSYALIIHEFGHLLAGLCLRFRLISIRFGPLEIRPPFRVSISHEHQNNATGFVIMLPKTIPFLRLRMAIMVLAGPGANLASAILLPLFTGESALTAWLVLFSYLMGIGNLVPFGGKGFDSDGRQLLMLSSGAAQAKRALAIMKLANDLNDEVAAEDFSPEWIAMATAVRDDSALTMVAHYLSYLIAWYTSTIEETGRLLEIALEQAKYGSPVMRQGLICSAGVFQARKCGRADLAREWLADLPQEKDFTVYALNIEAAILEAEGDIPAALAKLDELEKTIVALANEAKKRPKLRLLQRWRSELQTQPHTAAAKMVSS